MLEDNPADRELLERELRRGGVKYVSRCVETEPDFIRELAEFRPDLVISDFSLPTFDGLSALRLCRERAPQTPFIFVSGTIGEETAVDALKQGATDYLLKGHIMRLCQAVTRAVHEAKEREERTRLETQLIQAQKMEAIGQLAGGVAHDFNNLLTAILGFADIALKRVGSKDPLTDDLGQIRNAGQRASELTRQLLAFSRKQIIAPRVVDLNTVVHGMEKLLRRVIGEDIDLITVLNPHLGRVKADVGQLEQVIMNLAVNARDAMPQGGKITIKSADADLDEAYARSHVAVKPGPYVMLAVSDTGCGMDKATLARLFEPFFTTKDKGKGTGLGLSTVYGIVKQSNGNIWVYSEPGQGSTFKIYLPRVEEPLAAPRPGDVRKSAAGGSEVILVVEDDEMVRNLARVVLRQVGYAVLEAGNGDEALRLCEKHPGRIHLLLTDVIMPQMGGRELARRLKQLRPDLRIVFFSGYTSNAIVHHGILESGLAFLQKPFTLDALTQKVRAVLDGTEGGGA